MERLFTFINNINFTVALVILAVVIYLGYGFLIIYHLIRFGIGANPKTASLVFFIGAAILLIFVLITYSQIDSEILFKNINKGINDSGLFKLNI